VSESTKRHPETQSRLNARKRKKEDKSNRRLREKEYRAKNIEKVIKWRRNADASNVRELKNKYLRTALSRQLNIPRKDITAELIETKRTQLQTHRLARQLKKAIHESSKDTDRIT
jgi:hypothetical protein